MSKAKRNKTHLVGPNGIAISRHHVDGEIRYTIAGDNCQKLVAIFRNGDFAWLHKDFQAKG